MPARDVLWIGALLALGILVRGVYLLTPALDSDQAIVGLMARHILEGEFPTFFWGQPFAGTLESHLAAPLFFLIGASRLALALSPFLFSLAFLPLTYGLARESFGRETGLLALALAAVPAPFLVSHSVTARANYIENLVLGSLLLLLALRLPFVSPPRRPRALFLLGFFAGLAWYESPQSVHYLATAALFLLLRTPRVVLEPAAWGLVPPAFLLGSLPFWVYNLRAPASTFEAIVAQASTAGMGDSLRRFVVDKLPYALGAAARGEGLAAWSTLLVVGLYALALLHVMRRWRLPGAQLLLLFIAVTSGILVLAYNQGGVNRYLLPLYSALPVVMASGLVELRRRARPAFAAALAALLAVNLAGNAARAEALDPAKRALYRERRERDAELFRALEADGLTRVYVFDFWEAYRLTFDARERIVFAEPVPSFYPPYTHMVDAAPRYAYVSRRLDRTRAFEAGLASVGGAYRKREIAGRTVFDAFVAPAGRVRPMDRQGWRVRASDGPAEAARAVDGDPFTSWRSAAPRGGESSYQVDLGSAQTVAHAAWLPRRPSAKPPARFRIDTSLDGERWQSVLEDVSPWPGMLWDATTAPSGPRLRVDASDRLHVRLAAPVSARWLRVVFAGRGVAAEWSIRELFLSEVDGGPAAPPWGPGADALARGRELTGKGEWAEALRAFRQAVDREPHAEEAHARLLDAAIQLGLDPDDAYERALVLERRKLTDLAARELWSAVQAFPHSHHSEPLRRLLTLAAAVEPRQVEAARRRLAALAPVERTGASFGGTLRLLGYTLDRREVEPGGQVRLSYFWECLRETRRDYTVFVHLRGDGIALGDDHVLLDGLYPTSRWRKGEVVREDRLIVMPADARPGPVAVNLGVWDPSSGRRLPIDGPAAASKGGSVRVVELGVTARRADAR